MHFVPCIIVGVNTNGDVIDNYVVVVVVVVVVLTLLLLKKIACPGPVCSNWL